MQQTKPLIQQANVRGISIWTLVVIVLIAMASFAIAYTSMGLNLVRIPPASIKLFEASQTNMPRSALAADNPTTLNRQRQLDGGRVSQYHIELALADVPQAVFAPSLSGQSRLYVNAIGVANSQSNDVIDSISGSHWLTGNLSQRLLLAGINRVDIVMSPSPFRIGLAELRTGTTAEVDAVAARFESYQNRLRSLSWIAGFVSLICLPLLLLVSRALNEILCCLLVGVFLIGRYYIGSTDFASSVFLQALAWSDVVLPVIGIVLLMGDPKKSQQGRDITNAMALSLVAIGAANFMLHFGWATFPFVAALNQVAPLTFALCGAPFLVLTGLKRVFDNAAASQKQLQQQAAIVVAQAEKLEQQAQWQAVLEERKRFTRDIHDGIGGQLVSLLWRVRSEDIPAHELANELESGIADLRLVADALDEGPVGLSEALWNFFARTRQQLETAKIALEWSLPNDFDVEWRDSRRVLSLYRTLQECVTNVVRHADARNLRIAFEQKTIHGEDCISILVIDDGVGFNASDKPAGRGLTNIKTRVAQLGGSVSFEPAIGTQGTQVSISVPIAQPDVPLA